MLFADLKGSMELLADRDPEEARRLLDPVVERMIEAVHAYEGTVNQVMGDGIMALFGAPLAHEDHAVRACYAALRMQERVGQHGDEVQRTHGVPLQIRVGLNSGEVVVRSIGSDLHMDYSAVGQTTHLAARLEQMAKPGSTLLSLATLHLAEGFVQVKPLGPVPVKGLAEPVEVFELTRAAPGRTRLQAAATRGLTRFVGRDAEMTHLHAVLDRAGVGHGEVVAVVGEPGAGKSRLAWELTHSHRTHGWLVLETSAVAYGRTTAWHPLRALLRTYFGIGDRDDARRIREKVAGKLLVLDASLGPALPVIHDLLEVGTGAGETPALADEQGRRRMIDTARRLFLRESRVQPVLIVLEDLHWVDADTQAFLDALVEGLPSARVLLLVNYRPEYGHTWGSKSYYSQVRLDPLSPGTASLLLSALLGEGPGLESLAAALIERAQGNPLYLEECVRDLAESGSLAGERGAYRLARPVQVVQMPGTVQALLAARIDRLSPDDKHLLQSASVIGTDVPLALLRSTVDVPGEALVAGLDRLQSAEFLYETPLAPDVTYSFKHALTQEVAYGSLLHERRRALHARVVEAIERLYADRLPEHRWRLVHHAFRSERWDKALQHLRDLGHEVASPEVIGEVMGVGPESPGLLWWGGQYARAARAAERDITVSASFGNFGLRVVSACRLGQVRHALGEFASAAELFRQVIASVAGPAEEEHFGMFGHPAVFARSWGAWALAELGEFTEGATLGLQGVQLAERLGQSYGQAHVAFGFGTLLVIQGRPDVAVPVLERGVVVARLGNAPLLLPFLAAPLGAALVLAGRAPRAVELLEQAVEQGASMKLTAHHALRLAWLAEARVAAGQPERALDHARRALDLAIEHGERAQQAHARRILGDIAAAGDRPDLEAAQAAYTTALDEAESLAMRPLAARCRLALGQLHHRLGDTARGRADLDAAAGEFLTLDMGLWRERARSVPSE